MRQDNPILEIARGVDTVFIGLWHQLVRVWRWLRLWWSSPWPYALGAALVFAGSTLFSNQPVFGFVLGCMWMYVGFRQAIHGPELVELRSAMPQVLGLFRIRLLTMALLIALLVMHSDYELFTKLAYAATTVIVLLGLDKDIKR